MVSLKDVQASNSQIKSTFPSELVAVFVGSTSGIGAYALKEFAHRTAKPRIYFVGRSEEAADKLLVELKSLNPGGEYIFLKCDASLLRSVDELCLEIKARESAINVLFMSQGTLKFSGSTTEGLRYVTAVTYYGRIRFITNLLPILRAGAATAGLGRVVSVFAGSHEGPVLPDDWAGVNLPLSKARGHMASMLTLAHLKLRELAPEVSFVQNHPGAVKTGLVRGDEGFAIQLANGMYPALTKGGVGNGGGVKVVEGVKVAVGVDGERGSGVYSVSWDGQGGVSETEKYVREHTEAGLVEKLWEHTVGEFVRITRKKTV
ncbi:NAD(P)-binding protein [Coniochaeta hoffmannii]|uniref:NAD(P)-binding protein n=1 Tax=Coniochaeta hoffmannii TaxID=91930 RepID=A0AA38RZK6_9PEZI|nr:NAD(P)-binding protein [Coniochaeta hoffmannii]